MFDFSLVRYLPKDANIPFIKFRWIAMGISVLGIIVSIFLFSTRNLNYGIDFKGGTVLEFSIGADPQNELENIRILGNNLGFGGNVGLQSIARPADGTGKKPDDLRMSIPKQTAPEGAESDDQAQTDALNKAEAALAEAYPNFELMSTQVLGTKVSGELKKKGAMAVILALMMVLIYIWFRFEWQFGAGAVAALTHDVILTIGVFSFTALEFNLSIVAAILTIVGYSLNDTVIVYDRIRENLRKYKKKPLKEVLDLSINDTLSRTIMTSVTTLLALLALYIWGGVGLHGFAFAMIWGVLVGTYSSIFVAAPILLLLGVKRGGLQK